MSWHPDFTAPHYKGGATRMPVLWPVVDTCAVKKSVLNLTATSLKRCLILGSLRLIFGTNVFNAAQLAQNSNPITMVGA